MNAMIKHLFHGLLFWVGAAAMAQTPISQCAATLRYDVRELNQNLLATLTAVSSMSESTYESAKKDAQIAGVSPFGLFDGSYSEAQRKAREYQSSISESQYTKWSSKYLSHTLSPEGARAYAECVRGVAGLPIAAWIENTVTKTPIVVKVKLGDAWTAADIAVEGATPSPPPGRLQHGGSEAVMRFGVNPRVDFSITITARNPMTGQTRTVTVEQGAYRRVGTKSEYATDEGWVSCKAGCNGSTVGCRQQTPYTFTAPPGWGYEENTFAFHFDRARQASGGIRLNSNIIHDRQITKDGLGRLVRVVATPTFCEGGSAHELGGVEFPYSLRRSRLVAVEN